MKKIVQFSINRPATLIILIAAIVIIGFMNLSRLPVDLMPEMDLPYAAVVTSYAGAGPEEVEDQVTKPIENVAGTVANIDELMSVSSANSSMVLVAFNYGTNMDTAMANIRDKVSMVEAYLPDGAEKPQVMKMDINSMPVIAIGINGKDLSLAQLQTIAEDKVEPRLSRLSGVASVTITGGREREVKVTVDPVKAENYGLSLGQVASFLAADNYNMSSGSITFGERKYFARSLQEFESLNDIENVALTTATGNKIPLKNIAEVSEDYKDLDQITRTNGLAAVGIHAQKETDANTVEVCTAIKEEMEKIETELGGKIDMQVVMDQSDYINKAISSTSKTLMEGAILAVLIILLFLRNIRSTVIIGIAIPLSIVATFILMYYTGSTLNTITLGGLALGVGRMVDDSIVVFENIYRHRSLGLSPLDAALKGASEVGGAVLAGTLTLIAVFLPIGLAEGISGVLFKPLAFTICVAIGCSLLIAVTIVPFMSSRMLTDAAMQKSTSDKSAAGRLITRLGNWLDNLGEQYKVLLEWALGHRRKVILGVTGLLIASLCLIPLVGAEFIPASDEGAISITLEADKGSAIEDVDAITQEVEQRLLQNSAVDLIFTSVGSSGQYSMEAAASNKATLYVQLIPKGERNGVAQVAEEIRKSLQDIPGAKKSVSASSAGMSSGSALTVAIKGDDLDTLRELSDKVESVVRNVPGTREVTASLTDGNPEVQIRINRQRAMDYGLSPMQVSNEIRNAIDGKVATKYRLKGNEINVRVTSIYKHKSDMDTLKGLKIITAQGSSVALSELASFELATGPVQISRDDQARQATISCDLLNRDLNSVTKDVQAEVGKIQLPVGYTVDYGGQNEQMMDSFASLFLALLMAILLVYVVMVIQYESFFDPFIIMFSIPTAIIGVILGLLITGRSFSVTAFIGIIMLAGIVVSNAIVYIDYLKKLRAAGMERNPAIIEAGRVRLRPILMTALSTMLAMMPMAIGWGEGAEMSAPLATVVIGGLFASTFVTLLLIPVVYSIFDDWGNKFKKKSAANDEMDAALVN
ncbi:MAG: efflux RND transporter permease subunit [Syntrophomonas sp.]|nr:efflux RND transporter permease subunit [Syntrophomonas sp.]